MIKLLITLISYDLLKVFVRATIKAFINTYKRYKNGEFED